MTSWRLLYSGKNTSYILSITTQAKTLIDFYKEGRQTINQGSKLDVKFWSISKSMALFFILSFFKKKDHLDKQGFERAYNVFTAWACWRLYLYCWLLCIGFSLCVHLTVGQVYLQCSFNSFQKLDHILHGFIIRGPHGVFTCYTSFNSKLFGLKRQFLKTIKLGTRRSTSASS